MQIVESSVWAVRTARLVLRSPNHNARVTLFPMIHVGEPDFYETVYRDAFSHDLVLVEGVASPVARRITRSYRWIRASKKIDLAVQPPYPSEHDCNAKIVHADMSRKEFEDVWRNVPLWLRLLVHVAAPARGLWFRWFGTRETLAEGLTLDDLPRREEILNFSPETIALCKAILDARDRYLIERLNEQLDRPDPAVERIAVVYGAAHMRAVLRELKTFRGYYVERADWLTVFPV